MSEKDQGLVGKLIGSTEIFKGYYIRLLLQRFKNILTGEEYDREIVQVPNAVGIIALKPNLDMIMVRQYREAAGEVVLQIPAGLIDPGENYLQTASRELEEETGYKAGRIEPLFGPYFPAVGYSTGQFQMLLATDLKPGNQKLDHDERINVVEVPFEEAWQSLNKGNIKDSETMMAILYVKQMYDDKYEVNR